MNENKNPEEAPPNNVVDFHKYKMERFEKPSQERLISYKEGVKEFVKEKEAMKERVDRERKELEKWLEMKDAEYQKLVEHNANESVESYLANLDNVLDHFCAAVAGTKYEKAVIKFSDAFDDLDKSIKDLDNIK